MANTDDAPKGDKEEAVEAALQQTQPMPPVPVEEVDPKAEPIDPRTNQPLSDFLPKGVDDKHMESVLLQDAKLTAASGNARAINAQRLVEQQVAAEAQIVNDKAALEETRKETKRMLKDIPMVDVASYRARMQAEVAAEAQMNRQKEIRPGGVFNVNGIWVNAAGERTDAPD